MSDGDLLATLRADMAANRGSTKGRFVVTAFRLAQRARASLPPVLALLPVTVYRLVVDWLMGVELPAGVQAGPGLGVYHGTGLVVHARVRLGRGVTLRHGVTIGILGEGDDGVAPVLGDGVSVGAGAIILGPVHVGDGAAIGAGAVVIHDVPAGATVVGNPARVVRGGDGGTA